MKRFPKLRPCGWDGMIVLAVVLLSLFCGMTVWGGQDEAGELSVVISVDGEEVERCSLMKYPDMAVPYSANGYTLYVALDHSLFPDAPGIRVSRSDCPTQDCVHTGVITRSGQSIVCLPARIVIELERSSSSGDGPDLVIG